MSKSLLIDHGPILSPMVREFAKGYFNQLLFASLILSTALRVLQLPDKKLIQAKLYELLAKELRAKDE